MPLYKAKNLPFYALLKVFVQGSASGNHWVYQEFIETLRGNSPKVSSVIDAMHSVKLIEEIYKSRI